MRILLVGDTHGSESWWRSFVAPTATAERADLVLQLGDFGYWPSHSRFIEAAASSPMPVWFLDGNHEHFPTLLSDATAHEGPARLRGNISYLQRGTHLEIEGVTIGVLGGAHSIDRSLRTEGVDWFAQEAVSARDLELMTNSGKASIMLSHDAPTAAPVPLNDEEWLPAAWQRELPACAEHRKLLQRAYEALQPALVAHGHYHVRYDAVVDEPWGQVQFLGLAHNGTGRQNAAVLEIADGGWEVRPLTVEP
jgi:predicted phosphodiesterase